MQGLGFWRFPGDWETPAISHIVGWLRMEFFSDPVTSFAGFSPALFNIMEGFSSRDLTSLGQVIGSRLGGQFKKISFCYDNLRLVSFFHIYDPYISPIRLRFRDVRIRKGKKCHVQSNLLESVSVKDSVVQCYKLESLGQGSAPCTSSLKTILQSRNSNLRLSCLFGVLMASSAGGGDKGIITAMVAHPKPAGGGEIVMANQREEVLNKGTLAIGVATPDENQTTMEGAGTAVEVDSTTHQGPAAFIEGEVVEEDEDAIEVVIEEEEVQKAGQWTILARFYSLKSPNLAALFEDMRRAWRLRSDMTYKSLRDNLFIISFGAEGDYRFVIQGGPWIHRGDALLVAEFDGITCPSKVTLDVIPVWVRIYDLPLVLMTKARGEIYGSKLGRVREVDVGDDGRNKHDFFRIRVDLSVKRPLKDKLTIKISAQGRVETRSFALRYERVPHFCFICGFMGHADKDCDKRGANVENPFRFSADLRCSPLKTV